MSATGSVIAQFETADGERTGPQLDVPLGTTPAELAVIVNELLRNDEAVPYAFYVAEEEVSTSLAAAIGGASTEQAVRVVYVPQAVFSVVPSRAARRRCGPRGPIVSAQFAPGGKLLATGAGDHTVRLWDVLTETPKACCARTPTGCSRSRGRRAAAICSPAARTARWRCGRRRLGGTASARAQSSSTRSRGALHRDDAAGACARFACPRLYGAAVGARDGAAGAHAVGARRLGVERAVGGDGLLFTGSHTAPSRCGRRPTKLRAHPRRPQPLGELPRALDGRRAAHRRATTAAPRPPTRRRRRRRRRSGRRAAQPRRRAARLRLRRLHALPVGAGGVEKAVARLTGHVQLVNCVAFARRQLLASGSFDGAVRLWAARTGKFVATLRGHVGAVYQVSWSGDARLLASGSKDSTLKVWDARTRKLREDLPGHADEVYAVDWSPDGRHVASAGKDRNLKMWRA